MVIYVFLMGPFDKKENLCFTFFHVLIETKEYLEKKK